MFRRAAQEWQWLQAGLPAGVTVQAFEERLDLLRAVIEGPADTPYEGGLYIFDIMLPSQYPAVAPKAFYWAYNKYLNPNLYACGKVCLSLLGTWSGPGWEPETSTLLQLLVSIQGLILIEQPYCNEPGQQRDGGTAQSVEYNKACQAGIVDNMTKMLQSPPEGLKDVVEEFMAREGEGLLRRAAVLPNEQMSDGAIAALDAALRHPFDTPLTTRLTPKATKKGEEEKDEEEEEEKVDLSRVGGVEESVPKWLVVAEKAFTSGYGDPTEADQDDY